jgi:glycosyltransferase involved in cell wall biosynthesis
VRDTVAACAGRFRLIERDIYEPAHNPNTTRNVGLAEAKGSYIGFLDDDDYWCEHDHLEIASKAIAEFNGPDVFLADQISVRDEDVINPCWLPYLKRLTRDKPGSPVSQCHAVTVADVLQPEGIAFPSVNMTLIRRERISAINGFWHGSPYEGDLNFFLRLFDNIDSVIYRSKVIAVNVLRERDNQAGVSSISDMQRQLFRILVCEHARLHTHGAGYRYALLLQSGVTKNISKRYYEDGNFRMAADYARQAAGLDVSLKWYLISIYARCRELLAR